MAIIRFSPGTSDTGAEQQRPTLLIKEGWVRLEDAGAHWAPRLRGARAELTRAILATGRIRTEDASLPFIGTGFAVGPDLIATAEFIAKMLVKPGQPLTRAWIDFAGEADSAHRDEYEITAVVGMDPDAKLAILKLDRTFDVPRSLRLSETAPQSALGADICVVNYAGNDALRNDPAAVRTLFGDTFDVKRIAPGKITGLEKNGIVLTHDATTLAGGAGAPVIDLDTGDVVGMHFGGAFQRANYAVCAQILQASLAQMQGTGAEPSAQPHPADMADFDILPDAAPAPETGTATGPPPRSPQVPPPPADLARAAIAIPADVLAGAVTPREIFPIDDFIQVYRDFVGAQMTEDHHLLALFRSLPVEFVAGIAVSATAPPLNKLMLRLQYLNTFLDRVGDHLPFYVVLRTAEALTMARPSQSEKFRNHTDRVLAFEAELWGT